MARSRDAGYVSAFEVGVANTEIKDESYKSHSVSRMRTRDRGYISKTTIAGFIDESFESIATTNITTNTASVTFSSIPTTYKHLQIRMFGRTDRASALDGFRIQFNNNTTTSDYRSHFLGGNGSSAFSGDEGGTAGVVNQRFSGATATASMFGVSIIDILDYANTNKHKTVRCLGGSDQNGSGEVYLTSGVWMNSAAINEIDIVPNVGSNFVQYSSFALYGIKG